MYLLILRAVLIILEGILLSSHAVVNKPEGYRAVIRYEDGFLAAGSGGQIDWISASGKITKSEKLPGENFNCLLLLNQTVIVAGEKGSILISSDKGIFRKVNSGTDKNINSLTLFNGSIIAGADNGEIISGNGTGSFKKIHLALKGNIVSVSARSSDCYGVTDEGEIIHTINGINWEITDFNKVYSGYYKPSFFRKVLVTENRIAVLGIQNDGSPVMMFSNQGNVWTERTLNYTDEQGMKGYLTDLPNDIYYYDPGDEFYLGCSKGKLMILPSCSQCNKMAAVSEEDIEGISMIENTMMIVGGNFLIKAVNIGW
jgi:hypothetical protein